MNKHPDQYDIVVVGNGPAGMVAALQAARAGLSCALVGPAPPRDDRRTTALLKPSLDLLAACGLQEALADIGTPLVTMRLIDGTKRLVRAATVSFDAHELDHSLFGLNCPNAALNAVLSSALKTEAVSVYDDTVVDYRLVDTAPEVHLTSGETLSGRAVIAADGKGSKARKTAGIGARRWSYRQVAAVGVVRHTKPHDFISTEFHTESGPFTFVPLQDIDGQHRSSFVCALAPDQADSLQAMDHGSANQFLEERSLHLLGSLRLEEGLQLWPLDALVADTFAAKGVYLVGEAAHAFPPIGAQGLNLGIRDAYDAVSVLASGIKAGEKPIGRVLAARYSAKRRADVWTRTLGVDALNRSLLSKNPLVQLARVGAMQAVRSAPPLKRGLMMAGLEAFGLAQIVQSVRSNVLRQS